MHIFHLLVLLGFDVKCLSLVRVTYGVELIKL